MCHHLMSSPALFCSVVEEDRISSLARFHVNKQSTINKQQTTTNNQQVSSLPPSTHRGPETRDPLSLLALRTLRRGPSSDSPQTTSPLVIVPSTVTASAELPRRTRSFHHPSTTQSIPKRRAGTPSNAGTGSVTAGPSIPLCVAGLLPGRSHVESSVGIVGTPCADDRSTCPGDEMDMVVVMEMHMEMEITRASEAWP